jgi:hypothetical protein
MKIKDIKSDEVRNEAVRLAMESLKRKESYVLGLELICGFGFFETDYDGDFWFDLEDGTTPNTPDLKLPEKNPSE